jgi:hypothetical protein
MLAQRAVLADIGVDLDGRRWLQLPADDLVAWAAEEHPELCDAPPPTYSADRQTVIAWALLHPAAFARTDGRQIVRSGRFVAVDPIGRALHPGAAVLTAALIIHCLAEDTGLNLSTMLRSDPADLVYSGEEHALLHTAKARNHSEDRVPVRASSMFTTGGLFEALTGLTRFTRHYRMGQLAALGMTSTVANKLYVEHRADVGTCEILANHRIHQAWRSVEFDPHWRLADLSRDDCGLRFQALRSKALQRRLRRDPDGDVEGHGKRTRLHYLAHVLPEHVLAAQATGAQDDIVAKALEQFVPVQQADHGAAKDLAAAKRSDLLDVVVGVCTSAGNDPDDHTAPCSLGLAACFTCPNGYRTLDHIPGLLATVAFADIVRDNDPDEWENGEASLLHHYATECLQQFPKTVVDAVHTRTDLTAHIVTISSLYTEMRR